MRRMLSLAVVSVSAVLLAVSCTAPNEFTRGKALVDEARKAKDRKRADELYAKALPELEAAAKEGLGGAEGLYYLGVARYRTGRADDAVEAFQGAIEKSPDYLWPHYDLGVVYLGKRETDSAIAQLTKAAAINPDYTWAWHMLGKAYELKGDTTRAIESYERASIADAAVEYNYFQLGLLYAKAGRNADAEKAYGKYLELGTEPALRTQAKAALDKLRPPEPGIRDIKKTEPESKPATDST